MLHSEILNILIQTIATLPGLGPRSATRIVLSLATSKTKLAVHIGSLLKEMSDTIRHCELCNNIDDISPCRICIDKTREKTLICVVDNIEALWNIEQSRHYRGLYYVIETANEDNLQRRGIEIEVSKLIERLKSEKFEEVILANNPTVSGQTNVFYISDLIDKNVRPFCCKIKITRLGLGLPMGSEVTYLDEGTLLAAFRARQTIEGC